MKIAIDISSAVKPHPTGIGHSIVNLITALSEIDGENQYYLCCRLSRFIKHHKFIPNIEKPNFKKKIIQEPLNLFFPRKIDIFHSGGSRLPNYNGPKLIATFHDVYLLVTDEFASEAYRKWKTQRYFVSAQRADKIITVSEYLKKEILRNLPVPEEKVVVIHHGVDKRFYPRPTWEISEAKEKYSLKGNYILSVGVGRRKNTQRALHAFKRLIEELRQDLQFVLVGKFNQTEEYFRLAETPPLKGKVKFLGYMSNEDLPPLYSGAKVFFFPSLYEGFGIPVLEAMASGCPVVTSNVTALPEVAGEAALLVDPYNIEEMAHALCRPIKEEDLRYTLIQRGLERAKLFSWERVARQILDIYEKVYKG